MDWSEMQAQFDALPRCQDLFFRYLWQQGHAHLERTDEAIDLYDNLSARLLCAALESRQPLLIVLPDEQKHRAALLLATALIMHGADRYRTRQIGGQVLYFGTTTGIRQHLQQVIVDNIPLDNVFPQARTAADPTRTQRILPQHRSHRDLDPNRSYHFPRVITVYMPADPVAILRTHSAEWVAIDGDIGTRLDWAPALLNETRRRHLPVIAWCSNPLSSIKADFRNFDGLVFQWPSKNDFQRSISAPRGLENCFDNPSRTRIIPLYLDESAVISIIQPLKEAYHILAEAMGIIAERKMGPFAQDALHLAWGYLHALENLNVPLDFHEVETRRVWGLHRLETMEKNLSRFLVALQPTYPALANVLYKCLEILASVRDEMHRQDPPLWAALSNLCVEKTTANSIRQLVFPGPARRRLFAYAMLARYNVSEDDLQEIGVRLTSLKELESAFSSGTAEIETKDTAKSVSNCNSLTTLVGLPAYYLTTWMARLLKHPLIEILVYSYQAQILAQRIENWNSALTTDIGADAQILAYFARKAIQEVPESLPAIVQTEPQILALNASRYSAASSRMSLSLPIGDPVAEVSKLFQHEAEGESGISGLAAETFEDSLPDEQVEGAFHISFSSGWSAFFAPDDKLNVIVSTGSGQSLDSRYVQALRPGDKILFIHGQRRQSLYDLLVDRVHRNPAFELHVAFIRRWQNDLVNAYRLQQLENSWTLEELLNRLQRLGSSLTSTQTIRTWLQGSILAPDDPEDLRRLAEVLDLAFVRKNYRDIHAAANRLAGLHRSLAIRLNKWLEHELSGLAADDETLYGAFDRDSGLSLQDIRDSLLVLQIESICKQREPILYRQLRQLERRVQ